jgi:hypothetical protein
MCDTMAVYEMGHMEALFKTGCNGVEASISVAGYYLQVLYFGLKDKAGRCVPGDDQFAQLKGTSCSVCRRKVSIWNKM